MKRFAQLLGQSLRGGGRVLGSFALWTFWLVLAVALAVQIYIATTSDLAVPAFILRRLEARLHESGLRATFGRTSLDPSGRILVEEAQLSAVAYTEPILRAQALYVELNPWMLAVGQVQPREIRLTGATAFVPTMLSGTGRPEQIVRDFDATFLLGNRQLVVTRLSARMADLVVTARGVVPLPRASGSSSFSPARFFAERFPLLSRQAMNGLAQLAALESATLHFELAPAESGAAGVNLAFAARSLKLEKPFAAQARDLQAATRILVLNGVPTLSRIDATVGEVALPQGGGIALRGVQAVAFGRLQPDTRRFETRTLELTIRSLEAGGVRAEALSAELAPRPLPRLDATIAARVAGAPLGVRAETDLEGQSAHVRFDGSLSPKILEVLNRRLTVDLRRFFDFDSLEASDGEAQFGPKWKFAQLSAHVALRQIRAHGVTFDEGRARIVLDGQRFYSPEAFARVGENFARGSYEHDLSTRRYRFLLKGELRPMDIAPWFQPWWSNFFRQLEFPAAPPRASVDVQGVWRDGSRSAVFVHADAAKPIIRGAAFERVHTRLFIRPSFFDGLELHAIHGGGAARGTFTYATDPATRAWRTFDVAAESNLDLDVARQIGGPDAVALLAPFKLANAPELRLRGHFEGPASPRGRHHDFRVEASTAGDFRFQNFPLQDTSFTATLRDDEIVVDHVRARFGGGSTSGRARVWGAGEARRVNFDFTLKEASLGQAAAALEEFVAHQRNRPPAPPGKYVQEKASLRLDLAASAEGGYKNLLSYRGQGTAALHGAEIGEVPLLGALSELLKFTTLRLTSARANFRIEGPKLVFPEVAMRGSDAAIDAHGEYALDRHLFDFNAKLFPFQESGNLIKTVVGAVLTPLSNAFEVKLTGTLASPEWRLVLGPSNLIRSLSPDDRTEKPVEAPAASAPAPTTPATQPPRAIPAS